MRRALLAILAVLALPASANAGQWVAGDLHVHTTYSHDSWGGPGDDEPTDPTEYYTFGQTVTEDFAIAASRGLDFLAITDHNRVDAQSDPGWGFGGVLGIPAYENSIPGNDQHKGPHAQMLGATNTGFGPGSWTPEAMRSMERRLHDAGGLLQANHPSDPTWWYSYDEVPIDTMEVWNLPWFYAPPFPSSGDHDEALRIWQRMLDGGAHVAVTGGSDSHWKATIAGQGPGQPTTWVYVDALTVRGVLAGIRAGHTFVSAEPPSYAGPQVTIEGRVRGQWSALQGDTVKPGTRLRVRVLGAPGSTLQVVGDHDATLLDVPVTSPDFTAKLTPKTGVTYAFARVYGDDRQAERQDICRAIPLIDLDGQVSYCHNRIAMLALSSPMYFRPGRVVPLP